MRKNLWITIFLILLGVILAGLIDWPKGPDIDFTLFGKRFYKELKLHQGLDLQGGTHLFFEADLSKISPSEINSALEGVKMVISRRIDALGVAEPVIQVVSKKGLIVELPGIKDVDKAIELIGQTAQLEFREAILDKSIDKNNNIISFNYDDWKDIGLTGANFKKATVIINPSTQKPEIAIEFDKKGGDIFKEVTSRNIGKPLAIFLDKKILSAPTVQTAITEGKGVITGDFSLDQAKKLEIQLNAGALPVPIKLIEQRNIGPSLGKESVQKSLIAGLIGLLLVAIFMIGYFRFLGFVADVVLLIYALIVLALFKLIPVTLTLAGIGGFILSIGMAVDANILIFERIREELKRGKSLASAIESGFTNAWNSIRDGSISSLITCLILWKFGASLIKGFALTLGLGILVSLLCSMIITKTFLKISIGTCFAKLIEKSK